MPPATMNTGDPRLTHEPGHTFARAVYPLSQPEFGPYSCATSFIVLPFSRTKRTACARNSGGYGGLVLGMWTLSLRGFHPKY